MALLACGVERLAPGWGYRTLMLGWATSALAWVAALALAALRPRRDGSLTLGLSDVAAPWVATAGLLVLLLALKAALGHGDPLAAAAALAVVSTAGAGMAVQRRQEGWAFVAGLGVNLAASLTVWHFSALAPFFSGGVALLQANAVASAAVALLWLWWRRQVYGPPELRVAVVPLLGVQVGLGVVANSLLVVLPLLRLLLAPGTPLSSGLTEVGDGGGWLALALTAAAALTYTGRAVPRGRTALVVLTLLAAAVLAACFAHRWDTGNWLSYHVLLAVWGMAGLAVPVAGIIAASSRWVGPAFALLSAVFPAQAVRRWAAGVGLAVVGLALRGAWADPQRPYPSVVAVLSVAVAAAALALWLRRPAYVYTSGLLLNLMGFVAWLAWGPDTLTGFIAVQVLCLAGGAAFWSAAETLLRSGTPPVDLSGRVLPFGHAAVGVALALLAAVVGGELVTRLGGGPAAGGPLPWACLLALTGALVVGLWDVRARLIPAGLYAAGLLAVGLALARLDAAPPRLAWAAGPLLAGYTLLVAVVARAAPRLAGLRRTLHLSGPPKGWSEAWLLPAQAAASALVLVLSAWACVGFEAPLDRLAGPLSAGALVATGFLLAGRGPGRSPRYATLLLGVALLTELGWAALDPAVPAAALHRNVLLVSALAVTTAAYGVGLSRLGSGASPWAECGRRCGPVLGVLALLVLLGVLGQEFLLYDPATKSTPMQWWAVLVVAGALVGLMAAQVRFAVLPGSDPFGLSERRRTLYVYAAEALLLGLFLHVRLNMPWLFGGRFVQFWPLLVMALAFAGVGLAEFFARRGLPVLAGPLQRTGVFLPLLPLLVFWLRPPSELQAFLEAHAPGTGPLLAALHRLPQGRFDRYALLWFLLGVLYTFVALARRSSRFALAAALAANVGLWCLLYHSGLAFLAHPQMWLVPLALIVLVAEHLNRERLGPARSATLRYAGLGLLYLSSTADMFLAGLGHSVVLPLVLALLSVAGVLAGILLRVRAFLLLGVGFLGLVVFSMIWHAAVDRAQTWVWWASGIALGLAILGLFALFEKRRNDVLHVVEQLKKWE
jgi:hypothetical protein